MMEPNKARILVVDDEPENLKALDRTLRQSFEVVLCSSPVQAAAELEKDGFAVVISDQRMPGMLGTDLLAEVARRRPLVTRVILTAHTETKEILDAINRAEIYRYITKPWDNQELLATIQQCAEHHSLLVQNEQLIRALGEKNARLEQKERELVTLNQGLEAQVERRTAELREANAKLSELAMTDPLTRVLNRRAFFQRFHDELERTKRYKHPLAVAMIDVDHFKSFNDMEGHVYGDEALRKLAQHFTANLRKTDILGRYGGEEFVVLMPETRLQNAKEICDRLRMALENSPFQGKAGPAYITVSIGIAGFPGDGDSSESLIQAADQALYRAKQDGRNRVIVYQRKDASFFTL